MKYRVRNFSEEIFGKMGEELGKDFVDTDPEGFLDGICDFFTFYGGSIGDETNDINKYLKKVCDKHDITNEALNRIIENVHSIENESTLATSNVHDVLLNYKNVLKQLTDGIIKVEDGKPIDTDSICSGIEALVYNMHCKKTSTDQQTAIEMQQALEQYMDPVTGEYKWENIRLTLQADPNSISQAEIAALCLTYLTMQSENDLNMFLLYGYGGGKNKIYGSYEYVQGTVTPVFQAVELNTRLMVVGAIQSDTANGGDLSSYAGLLEKAQILTYSVNELPEAYFVVIPDEGYNPSFIAPHSELCIQSNSNGGVDLYHESKAVTTDYDYYRRTSHYMDRAEDYVISQQKTYGDIVVDVISDALLGLCIGTVGTLAAGALAAGASTAAGALLVKEIVESLFEKVESAISVGQVVMEKQQYDKDSSRFLNDMSTLAAVDLLGGTAYFIKGPDGSIVIFGADYNTTENAIRTYGFVNDEQFNTYGVGKKELEAIILSGGNSPNSKLTPEQQQQVYDSYDIYVNNGDYSYRYREHINQCLNPEGTPYSEEKHLEDCTPEEIRQLTAEYLSKKQEAA